MTRLQRLSFVALSSLLLSAACTSNDGGAGTSSDLDSGAALSDAEAGFDVPTNPDVALDVSNDSSLEDFGVDGACGATTVHASARDVALLLVVDASGSMNQTPKGFSTNKWSAMKTALSTSLGKVKEKLSLGLEIFPRDPLTPIADPCSGNCCAMPSGEAAIEVPVGPGVSSLDPIVSTLGSFSPGGATPTATALHRALDLFTRYPEPEARARLARERKLFATRAERERCLAEARAVLAHPPFAMYFDPARYEWSANETPVLYRDAGREVYGVIDRLVAARDGIMIIDYKTHEGAHADNIERLAAAYREGMRAYAEGVRRLWPGRRVRALLLFTACLRAVEVGDD